MVMRRLTLSLVQEKVLVNLLEVEIETHIDMYGDREGLEHEEEWESFKVKVGLYTELGGSFDTHLLRESKRLVEGEG